MSTYGATSPVTFGSEFEKCSVVNMIPWMPRWLFSPLSQIARPSHSMSPS